MMLMMANMMMMVIIVLAMALFPVRAEGSDDGFGGMSSTGCTSIFHLSKSYSNKNKLDSYAFCFCPNSQ